MAAFYLAATASALAGPAAAQGPSVHVTRTPDPAVMVDPDALYRQRSDILKAKQAADVWQQQSADGKNYEASWKLARAAYFLATQGPPTEGNAQLDRGLTAGKQATAIEPSQPEGHFWYAANMGEKAERGGMIAGLKYKGDIKIELERVIAIQPGWQDGSAESALGQWYLKVPDSFMCCGGDHHKGIELLRKALTYNPESSQIRYSLAEALSGDDRTRAEARTLLQAVIAAPIDPTWAVEDQSFKAKAKALLDKLNQK
jgi:tetratricopeptide (TPR) repeat protein